MEKFYNGTKILSMNDINGNKPELYIVSGNRSSGKTTFFSRYFIKKFINKKEKFLLLYRYNYELDNVSEKFFKEINALFFQNYTMVEKRKNKGVYIELYLNDELCGYATSINNADMIKKLSHLFSDVKRILFDEFQSETNHYCDNEINKFISIHTSIARGGGNAVRYVPVFMLSNTVSLLNPYFTNLGISSRIKKDTKFLKGNGYVFEQNMNEKVSNEQKESGFNLAFSEHCNYISYMTENIYMNDSLSFIEKPKGENKYLATIKIKNCLYSIREYEELGILYCSKSIDKTNKNKISISASEHEVNYVMLRNNDIFIQSLRYYFEQGCFRFEDISCKDAIINLLSY